jgi:hypothetical protein
VAARLLSAADELLHYTSYRDWTQKAIASRGGVDRAMINYYASAHYGQAEPGPIFSKLMCMFAKLRLMVLNVCRGGGLSGVSRILSIRLSNVRADRSSSIRAKATPAQKCAPPPKLKCVELFFR